MPLELDVQSFEVRLSNGNRNVRVALNAPDDTVAREKAARYFNVETWAIVDVTNRSLPDQAPAKQ